MVMILFEYVKMKSFYFFDIVRWMKVDFQWLVRAKCKSVFYNNRHIVIYNWQCQWHWRFTWTCTLNQNYRFIGCMACNHAKNMRNITQLIPVRSTAPNGLHCLYRNHFKYTVIKVKNTVIKVKFVSKMLLLTKKCENK